MAFEIPGFQRSWTVGATDLGVSRTINSIVRSNGYQYMFVKFSGGLLVPVTANTDKAVGVLQNKPGVGLQATVMVSGVTRVASNDATIIVGSPLVLDGFGMVVAQGTSGGGSTVVGIAEEAAASGSGFTIAMALKPFAAVV